jgi:4-hydroxybenzoate polyprenyltransferase
LSEITPQGYITLLRPANVVTALADVLAGYALAGLQNPQALPWLLLSTASLYAGGIVLNDFFDRNLDRIERPERPIPAGRVRPAGAALLGGLLLAVGVIAGAQATRAAAVMALAIAGFVLLYDVWGKRHPLVGPVNMGLCRALNLLLGAAAVPSALAIRWPIALIPLIYIASVTALSRGEVHGGRKRSAAIALVSLSAALLGLAMLVVRADRPLVPLLVLGFLAWRVLPAFLAARRSLEPERIRHAVRRGVLSLVLVNAVIGAVYAGAGYAALILATALIAGLLARMFPVT